MMSRISIGPSLALITCTLISAPARAVSSNAFFWISTSNSIAIGSQPPSTPSEIPLVSHTTAQGFGTFYIWGRPDANSTLENWSLRVLSTDKSVIQFPASGEIPGLSAVDILNPSLGSHSSGRPRTRWTYETQPAGSVDAAQPQLSVLDQLQGFCIPVFPTTPQVGVGIGSQGSGRLYAEQPNYYYSNPSIDAWILAQVNYIIRGAGSADVYLQIGQAGMNALGSSPSELAVHLGATGEQGDPPLGAGDDQGREMNSATPEARFLVRAGGNAADFDADSDVDGKDFLTWQVSHGLAGASSAAGDANGDRVINAADFALWKSQFGRMGDSALAVPELDAALMALSTITAFGLAKRRSRLYFQLQRLGHARA